MTKVGSGIVNKYIGYVRVSTSKQGSDGYGASDQKETIQRFVGNRELLDIFVEVESGSRTDRPELTKALRLCKETGATLVIANISRLARNVRFIGMLQESKIKFVCCDMPEASELTINIMAAIAQDFLKTLRINTKKGLAQAKKRGVKLGNTDKRISALGGLAQKNKAKEFAAAILPIITEIKDVGKVKSLKGIADALNARGIKTRTKKQWYSSSVKNVLQQAA